MSAMKTGSGSEGKGAGLDASLRERELRQNTYRERALKLFPWVCAKCGREFTGKKIRELTVHHKDHNHENNPPDGSNWELLCLYCHDNEHSRGLEAEWQQNSTPGDTHAAGPVATHNPFAALKGLLNPKK